MSTSIPLDGYNPLAQSPHVDSLNVAKRVTCPVISCEQLLRISPDIGDTLYSPVNNVKLRYVATLINELARTITVQEVYRGVFRRTEGQFEAAWTLPDAVDLVGDMSNGDTFDITVYNDSAYNINLIGGKGVSTVTDTHVGPRGAAHFCLVVNKTDDDLTIFVRRLGAQELTGPEGLTSNVVSIRYLKPGLLDPSRPAHPQLLESV